MLYILCAKFNEVSSTTWELIGFGSLRTYQLLLKMSYPFFLSVTIILSRLSSLFYCFWKRQIMKGHLTLVHVLHSSSLVFFFFLICFGRCIYNFFSFWQLKECFGYIMRLSLVNIVCGKKNTNIPMENTNFQNTILKAQIDYNTIFQAQPIRANQENTTRDRAKIGRK